LGQPSGAIKKVTGDIHAKDGSGKAKISHVEPLACVCLGGGYLVEGIGDEDVVDVDHDNANAMNGVVHGV
jgi:hypothetical protein